MSSEEQRKADSSSTPTARRVGTRFHPRGLIIPPRGRCEHHLRVAALEPPCRGGAGRHHSPEPSTADIGRNR